MKIHSELEIDAVRLCTALADSVVLEVVSAGLEAKCIRLELGEGDTVEVACMIPVQDLVSLGLKATISKWEDIIIDMIS